MLQLILIGAYLVIGLFIALLLSSRLEDIFTGRGVKLEDDELIKHVYNKNPFRQIGLIVLVIIFWLPLIVFVVYKAMKKHR